MPRPASPTRAHRRFSLALLAFLAIGAAAALARPFSATPTMAEETRMVVRMLEEAHYANRPLRDGDFEELISRYMEDLDPRKLFFLESDRREFTNAYRLTLGDSLRIFGDIKAAFAIYNRYEDRVRARTDWVRERLKGKFDLAASDQFVIDREKLPWPADPAEADQLWDQRLRAELIEVQLREHPPADAQATVAKRYERLLKNLEEIETGDLQELFLSALMSLYDPHSSFMSSVSTEDFAISMRLSLIGIGAILSQDDGYCVIRELVPGGPAALSRQLSPNDKIIAVAQEGEDAVDATGMKLRKVVKMIRGQQGSRVTLTIQPAGTIDPSQQKQVLLVRDVIKLNEQRAKAAVYDMPGDARGRPTRVGVVTVPAFYGSDGDPSQPQVAVSRDVRQLLKKLQASKVDAVVLDLRRNGGGLLTEAVDLVGLFITQGPVVQVRDAYNRTQSRSDTDRSVAYAGPLVVLTDRFSASASEIAAGALQNYRRAIVVGDSSTHGKGTVQQLLDLREVLRRASVEADKAGSAKLTVQKFYLPSGESTQKQGVVPDIILPSLEDLLPIGEGSLPHALAWDRIPGATFRPLPRDEQLLPTLRRRSEERQRTKDDFGFLRRSMEFFRERQAEKSLSLNLELRRQEQEKEKRLSEDMRTQARELAKADYSKTEILIDGAPPEAKALASAPAQPAPAKPESAAAGAPPAAQLAQNTVPTSSDGGDADEPSAEDGLPALDVHLREGLRIALDYVTYLEKPQALQPPPTSTTRSAPPQPAPPRAG